ncbi:hypothetical protein MLD38_026135 [Melastoma candidum]|uniref:Uncharacterized protein n=1 Tax=Melastoma candidum TaxID=119954 RepID=A0ACB9NZ68_9MYRT|nr:hypothetical protein MLD38_026135 [Melastoma candidum]
MIPIWVLSVSLLLVFVPVGGSVHDNVTRSLLLFMQRLSLGPVRPSPWHGNWGWNTTSRALVSPGGRTCSAIQRSKFNVSNNNFTGPIPDAKGPFTADSFSGNPGLCGHPLLNPCPVITISVTTISAITTATFFEEKFLL